MVRLTMFLLCLLLAAAAAGRYQAEVAVRQSRKAIELLKTERASELQQIQTLRAEIAYLENPQRLAALAAKLTDLKPLSADQLMSAEDFRVAFGGAVATPEITGVDDPAGRLAMVDIATIE
jgi:hypothetical protein